MNQVSRIEIPKNAPVVASQEALVSASIEVVWRALSELEKWPQWNESVTQMRVRGPLEVGTEFHWVAGGIEIRSRIEDVEAPNRIAWSGTTMGIRAVHLWELSSSGIMTKVRTEEAFQGLVVRLFAKRMERELKNALAQGLAALKREAESRHHAVQA